MKTTQAAPSLVPQTEGKGPVVSRRAPIARPTPVPTDGNAVQLLIDRIEGRERTPRGTAETGYGDLVAVARRPPIQRARSTGAAPHADPGQIGKAAKLGTSGAGGPLPYLDVIQQSFGEYDVTGVVAHTDEKAENASKELGATAFTIGNHVAFAGKPSLHTAAHEAAHVIQQRGGVQLAGGVGRAGDRYEQHADLVADYVVAGQSVEPILGQCVQPAESLSGGRSACQRLSQKSSPCAVALEPRQGLVVMRQEAAPSQTGEAAAILEKIKEIHRNSWVGPLDEGELEELWSQLPVSVVAQQEALFKESVSRGAELEDLPQISDLAALFESDVKQKARQFLILNREVALAEASSVGIDESGKLSPMDEEQSDRLEDNRQAAEDILQAEEAQAQLRNLQVGWNHYFIVRGDMGQHLYTSAHFDPQKPPELLQCPPGESGEIEIDWAKAKKIWDDLSFAISKVTSSYPLAYMAMGVDKTAAMAMGGQTARKAAAEGLTRLLANIDTTEAKLAEGDDFWMDLKPIHESLYRGEKAASGTRWASWLPRFAAEELISSHETKEFWKELGLGTLAAAAFVVAELASGGLATLLLVGGVGLTGYQAVASWEKYSDLSAASKSNASEELSLVSRAQADAAFLEATLNTAFAALDLVGGVKALRQGGKVVAKEVGEVAGKRLSKEVGETAEKNLTKQAGEGATKLEQKEAQQLGKDASSGAGRETVAVGEALVKDADEVATAANELAEGAVENLSQEIETFIGRSIKDGAPPGYFTYKRGGQTFIRRPPHSKLPRLFVDENGLIQRAARKSQRLSSPARMAKNIARVEGHQRHHLVPDEVVRKHPLFKEARLKGKPPYDLDETSNLINLPTTNEARIPDTASLPLHSGSHPEYSKVVRKHADEILEELTEKYGSLSTVPAEELTKACQRVESEMFSIIMNWTKNQGAKLW